MRCPNCGQWNRPSIPACVRCGTALEQTADAPSWQDQLKIGKATEYIRVDEDEAIISHPDERDALAREMAELKQRKEMGDRQQRRLREESAQRGAAPSPMTIRTHTSVDTFWTQMDTPPVTPETQPDPASIPQEPAGQDVPPQAAEQDIPRQASPIAENVQRMQRPVRSVNRSRTVVRQAGAERVQPPADRWQSMGAFDPSWADGTVYDNRTGMPRSMGYTGKLPTRGRGLRRFMYTLALLLTGAVIGLGLYFGLNWYNDHKAIQAEQNRALVSASIHNNLAAHTIMIPGEDGQQIYIRELHTAYIVTEGYATIEVEDHVWYDDIEDFTAEHLSVTLTPFVKTASGQQKPLELITYEIEVPLSPITLVTPEALRYEVVTAMYSMSFDLRPGSIVKMNGQDISDTLDAETGSLCYNATVQPIGDNVFTLSVRSPYCRENSITVVLYREPQEIPLDLSADTYTSTTLHELEIKATTMPGAEIDVLSPHTDLKITELDSTGEFSFIAVFDQIGDNTVTITASYPGKKTSVVNYVIYYLPPVDTYTKSAWPLASAEYAELISNITYRAAHNQVYVVMGKLAYLVSEKPQMGVFYTSDDGKSQPVLVENCTKKNWEVGTYYRIYADAYGTYNNMPWLCGRYVYLK